MTRELSKLTRLQRAQSQKRLLAAARLGTLANRENALHSQIEACEAAMDHTYFAQPTLSKSLAIRLGSLCDQVAKLRLLKEKQEQLKQLEEARMEKIEGWIDTAELKRDEAELAESTEAGMANQIHASQKC